TMHGTDLGHGSRGAADLMAFMNANRMSTNDLLPLRGALPDAESFPPSSPLPTTGAIYVDSGRDGVLDFVWTHPIRAAGRFFDLTNYKLFVRQGDTFSGTDLPLVPTFGSLLGLGPMWIGGNDQATFFHYNSGNPGAPPMSVDVYDLTAGTQLVSSKF